MKAHCPYLDKDLAKELSTVVDSACNYPASDYPLFALGYQSLLAATKNATRVMEVCCGEGELVCSLATERPTVEFVALDFRGYALDIAQKRVPTASNIKFLQADALAMADYADESFDVIYGQATLHHLANNLDAVRTEYSRLLKPSGKLIFIFEPLGHSWLVAAVRAIRFSISQAPDESNLYFSTLEKIGTSFSATEIQCFNYIGYPLKAISDRKMGRRIARVIHNLDHALCQAFPSLVKYGANFNVIFTK